LTLAAAHGAGDAQAVFVAHLRGGRDDGGIAGDVGRFGDDLHDALVVAQVDEAQAAEVAGDVGPAAQGDGLADQRLVDEAAEMGTHGGVRTGRPGILAEGRRWHRIDARPERGSFTRWAS
jgi:hypothetical protein